jgi:hypothetical protein
MMLTRHQAIIVESELVGYQRTQAGLAMTTVSTIAK